MLNSMLKIFVGPVMGGLNPHQPPVNTPLLLSTFSLALLQSCDLETMVYDGIGPRDHSSSVCDNLALSLENLALSLKTFAKGHSLALKIFCQGLGSVLILT
jgi:hypothetical protein